MEERGWIGIDLDGTLAIYTYWQGIDHIGDPIIPMIELVKNLLQNGQQVKIFTARVCSTQTEQDQQKAVQAIEEWCEKHIGQKLPITAEKDWHMIECYDDRCIRVEFNTGELI